MTSKVNEEIWRMMSGGEESRERKKEVSMISLITKLWRMVRIEWQKKKIKVFDGDDVVALYLTKNIQSSRSSLKVLFLSSFVSHKLCHKKG